MRTTTCKRMTVLLALLCLLTLSAFPVSAIHSLALVAPPGTRLSPTPASTIPVVVMTLDAAKEIALESAGKTESEVFLVKLNIDHDRNRKEFEVDFLSNETMYEFEIDAQDGTILESSTETVHNKRNRIDPSRYIGFEKAIEVTLAEAGFTQPDVTLVEMQFDFDDGREEYEIAFVAGDTEYDYELDAVTGEIKSAKTERQERRR